MQSMAGKDKKNILPPEQQVHITLEKQEEINQLYAMLNFIPIAEAINIKGSGWENLKKMLKENGLSENYFGWHNLLSYHF